MLVSTLFSSEVAAKVTLPEGGNEAVIDFKMGQAGPCNNNGIL